jgi:phosphoribosylformylglycinamidine synthase subunit PurSL
VYNICLFCYHTRMRVEIIYTDYKSDGRSAKLIKNLQSHVSSKIRELLIADIYLTDCSELSAKQAEHIFSDPVAQSVFIDTPLAETISGFSWNYLVEISYKPGVTDPVAISSREAIESELEKKLSPQTRVQTARQYLIIADKLDASELHSLQGALYNDLIQRALTVERQNYTSSLIPKIYDNTVPPSDLTVLNYNISAMDQKELMELSKKRLLALSDDELQTIKEYYSDETTIKNRAEKGLGPDATDLELEMIAQTWSEHCKHKILNADISYIENGSEEKINSLFKTYIKKTTDMLSEKKKYLRSVFHDDSGVINFDDEHEICFKVETHNSPSALDPYGGAITGIVGVNRDILGTGKGARPIFNTNYLCFADPETPDSDVPEGLLPPRRVLSGVHQGIVDGGNQSGIPVVGGGFLFDESYLGKPLVFCGTGGILPHKINGEESWVAHIDPGDLVVMTGGRIGKDGIHGATFSSLALDEESPTSAVQIGDPITQKKMSEFLMEARDQSLYKGITDNGAGGLSSSVGEMAEASGGVRLDLEKCPLKYSGLAAWEILVSESQERMSLAISKDTLDAFFKLAEQHGVEATVIGQFTDSGFIEAYFDNKIVGLLDIKFLHDGLPPMKVKAVWDTKTWPEIQPKSGNEQEELLKLLAEPTIASKENLIRQYDHEVQAGSVIKPFTGPERDGPSDGAVYRPKTGSKRGITVTHGACPRVSDVDAWIMAVNAVDEAYRAHIAIGGDPDHVAALDNFCWPDPIVSDSNPDGEYKAAQLVRACKGLQKACLDYGLPLISGKDSMKNDAVLQGKKISVRPTLLVSLMGIIEDTSKAVSSDFKNAGDIVYLLGKPGKALGGSYYEKISGTSLGDAAAADTKKANILYRALHKAFQQSLAASCHDISDGGLAVALTEAMIGGKLGCTISLDKLGSSQTAAQILFNEEPSRFVVSVPPRQQQAFETCLQEAEIHKIGTVCKEATLTISHSNKSIIALDCAGAEKAWKRL